IDKLRHRRDFAVTHRQAANDESLLAAARTARQNAVAPFSGFQVGAALLAADGQVFTGCNIENATYGLTVCAERVALWKALSEGVRQFERVAVVTAAENPTPPCGPCRQLLWEYAGDIEVVIGDLTTERARHRLSELFPYPFEKSY